MPRAVDARLSFEAIEDAPLPGPKSYALRSSEGRAGVASRQQVAAMGLSYAQRVGEESRPRRIDHPPSFAVIRPVEVHFLGIDCHLSFEATKLVEVRLLGTDCHLSFAATKPAVPRSQGMFCHPSFVAIKLEVLGSQGAVCRPSFAEKEVWAPLQSSAVKVDVVPRPRGIVFRLSFVATEPEAHLFREIVYHPSFAATELGAPLPLEIVYHQSFVEREVSGPLRSFVVKVGAVLRPRLAHRKTLTCV